MSRSISSMVRCSTLFGAVGAWVALAQSMCAQVTIEIVNDSGRPDSSVFLKAPGFHVPGHSTATLVPPRLFVDLSDPAPDDPASAPLSSLAVDGAAPPYQIVSSVSGNTNTENGIELRPVNGQWLVDGVPARWLARPGTNQVVVTVVGPNDEVLFSDWLAFELAAPFTVSNGAATTTHSSISNAYLYGQKRSQPAPEVSGFLNGTTATNFLVSTDNVSLVLGLTYVPAETRRYAPIAPLLQGGPVTPVRIVNPERLPGGGIRFSFNVASEVPYSIESSPDLTSWQTIATGLGGMGTRIYSSSNAPSASRNAFFRINTRFP